MSENLTIQTEATLTNINPRIEYHGEDKALALDLKFEASLAAEHLDQLAPVTNDISKTFWRDNPEKEARYPQFKSIKTDLKFKEHRVIIALDKATDGEKLDIHKAKVKMTFEPATIAKIDFEPQLANVAYVSFTVQIECKGQDFAKLCDQYLSERVMVLIEPLNRSLV